LLDIIYAPSVVMYAPSAVMYAGMYSMYKKSSTTFFTYIVHVLIKG